MPSEQTNGFGLLLKGLIMDKGTWKNNEGAVNHQIHVAVPGQRGTMQVGVSPAAWDRAQPMQPFEAKLSMITTKDGRAIFNMVE